AVAGPGERIRRYEARSCACVSWWPGGPRDQDLTAGGQMADAAPAVFITGATSGLGRYLAGELAGSGWQVLAHGRDPARVAALSAELGDGARGYVADLASLGCVRELAAQVRAEVPRLDVLVNNAGIGFGAPGETRQVSADGHELRFAVNYLAPVLLTRLLLPLLTASAPSRVVNVDRKSVV